MGQATGRNWVEAQVAMEKVWRCGCWDCTAHRRHMLRKGALVAVLLGLSFTWATATAAGTEVIERVVTAASEGSAVNWF